MTLPSPPGGPIPGPHALTRGEFTRRTLIAVGVVALAAALATAFVLASDVVFLFFAAVLLAILLRGISDAVARRTGLGGSWALALVLFLLVAAMAVGGYFAGSTAVEQLDQFVADLPKMLDQGRAYLRRFAWGERVLRQAPTAQDALSGALDGVAPRVARFFSTTFGALGSLLVLVFLAVYLAAAPGPYLRGTLALVPPRRRPRAEQVLREIGSRLRWWLIGRSVAMTAVGVLTLVGLWFLGVPQALLLAIVAGLLTAIPFLGPILALLPAVLVGLMQGPATALWVAGLYTLTQAAENYLVTPLVQQNTANLPPVVAIGAIALAGSLFGVLGLIVASPLAVALLVAVRRLYIEDVLGDAPGD